MQPFLQKIVFKDEFKTFFLWVKENVCIVRMREKKKIRAIGR